MSAPWPPVVAPGAGSPVRDGDDLRPSEAALLADVHRGQLRIAYRLADAYAGRLLHVYDVGWHFWDGARWAEDDQGAARQAVYEVLRAALADSLGDRDLRADVRRCETDAGVAGVLKLATALPEFAVTVRDLDADPYLLNCANGTLDLRSLELRRHDPADRITKVTTAAYSPGASGDLWDAFLARTLPDDDVRGFVRRYVGLALAGAVLEHCLAIFKGAGRNGKGVLYESLIHALGEYAATAEPDLFMHREGAHPTGEMDLRGRRFVVVSESDEGRRLAEATVKRLTGGDRIKARKMRKDFVEFRPSHTAALVTNHLPKVRGDDPALWARLRVVPFDVVIPAAEQDPRLTEKLRAEADAILAWAVSGWQEYQARGLAEPEQVLRATEAYQLDSDVVARFLEERCVLLPMVSATTSQLHGAFVAWARETGEREAAEMSAKALGQALDRKGYGAVRTRTGMLRRGIGLASEGADDAQA